MPNWCNSYVEVSGKPKDVKGFCKLFVWEEETDKEEKKKPYFARSFTNASWKNFEKENKNSSKVGFPVDFAWSCWSCLFDGYPKKDEYLTLKEAVKKFNVSVEIETEEGGIGFEETIKADKNNVCYDSQKMTTYECKKCKSKEMIASSYDLEDYECCECGASKWREIK